MKKIKLLLAFLILTNTILLAQKVNVSSNGLTINSYTLTAWSTVKKIETALGKADRVDVGLINGNSRRTYDKYGLSFLMNSNSNIESIDVYFRLGGFSMAPKNVFKGAFTIYGIKTTKYTTIRDLDMITFIKSLDLKGLRIYEGVTPDLKIFISYVGDLSAIEHISIAFNK